MSVLQELTAGIENQMREVWRHLHRNPELSMKEYHTADYIEELLRESVTDGRIKRVGKTGIWVELAGKAPAAGTETIFALRGDMDALPIQEENDLPYKSAVPGVMHACGHDVHTAALLGAVKVLQHYLDRIPGKLWFFFQPGEETLSGALTFLEDPDIDFGKLSGIAGVHVAGDLDAGKVRLKEGPVLASADLIKIRVTGQDGHAAYPHNTRDPIVAAAHLIVELQTLVSREVNPLDSAVLSLGLIRGGTKDNIIARDVYIEGTLRTLDKEVRTSLQDSIRRVSRGVALALRVSIDVEIENGALPLINDSGMVKIAVNGLEKTFGAGNVVFAKYPRMGGEDFSYFTDKVPGVFIFIGAKTQGGKSVIGHTVEFYTDPQSVKSGILAFCSFALEAFGIDP
ncbi:MAG: amidohydrolase [Spirochaetales bacterium]|jgi:amidohydrolase|nr:amidohydrolase [Spirochaetales bacterium]